MKVIFVCLGNICRSPMAEFICKHLLKTKYQDLNVEVDSAGTSGWNDGDDVHIGTKSKLKEHKIDYSGFVSKKLTQKLFDENDIVFVMDNNNYETVINKFKNNNKVIKMTDYLKNQKYSEVPDPWYTNNFDETYKILSESIDNFLYSLTLKK